MRAASFARPLLVTSFVSAMSLVAAACGGRAADGSPAPSGEEPEGASTAPTNPVEPARTAAPFCVKRSNAGVDRAIFDALTPSPPADYLALRHLTGGFDEPDGGRELVTEAERGERCATAKDRALCERRYRSLGDIGLFFSYVFFTRGDEVGTVEDAAAAVKLVGTVDSPEDAFFVARFAGFAATCDGEASAAYRATDDGFELVAESGGCNSPVSRVVVRVRRDGTVEEVSRKTIGPSRPCM